MKLPRLTIRSLMIAVAFVAVEFGIACWLHGELTREPNVFTDRGLDAWSEVGITLAFLNLLIGIPFIVFTWAFSLWRRSPAIDGHPIMKPPRFTFRRLIAVVAIVAVIIGLGFEGKHRQNCFSTMSYLHNMNKFLREENLAHFPDPSPRTNSPLPQGIESQIAIWEEENRNIRASLEMRVEWHRRLIVKYEWAARYPWLPVWPDPPEPE
jgi:hypothetical protein